jgi:hypothetical protein
MNANLDEPSFKNNVLNLRGWFVYNFIKSGDIYGLIIYLMMMLLILCIFGKMR